MTLLAFTDARVIDPASGRDGPSTLLVRDGMIAGVAEAGDPIPADAEVLRHPDRLIVPGLIDTRVFSGEPGGEHRETIASLGAAAAAGGVTTAIVMPDTDPVIDEAAIVSFVRETAELHSRIALHPAAALTVGLRGEALAEIGLMLEAGAIAASQGARPISDGSVLRRALSYARDFDIVVDLPPIDASLSSGVMNAGFQATLLGLAGVPPEAETIALLRDLELAQATRARLNVAGLSLGRSLAHVRRAKSEADVTASATINHLSLNEIDVGDYRSYFRLDPPLRSEEDRLALVDGLADGTIDMVTSCHDPHDADTKRVPFGDAATGAIGLETLLAALLRLHHSGSVPLSRLIEVVTSAPARRFGLEAGTLRTGAVADFAIVDVDTPWVVKEDEIVSASRNTAFEGARFQGRVMETWKVGRRVFALDDR